MPPIPFPEDPYSYFPSHLCLGLPCSLFPTCLPTETLYAPLLSSTHTHVNGFNGSEYLHCGNFMTPCSLVHAYQPFDSLTQYPSVPQPYV